MLIDLFSLETSTGDGDGGTEGESTEGTETESQEGTESQSGQSDTVPRSELAKVNAEAAKYRRERNDLKKRVEELEGHSKTELERERERATQAQQALQDATAKNLLLRAATLAPQAGISVDAARDAALLLDWDEVQDPEDDDQVIAAFKDLVKEKPYLGGRRGSADGGAGTSGGGNEPLDMNAQLRRATGRA